MLNERYYNGSSDSRSSVPRPTDLGSFDSSTTTPQPVTSLVNTSHQHGHAWLQIPTSLQMAASITGLEHFCVAEMLQPWASLNLVPDIIAQILQMRTHPIPRLPCRSISHTSHLPPHAASLVCSAPYRRTLCTTSSQYPGVISLCTSIVY
jgi:hypothetical protein